MHPPRVNEREYIEFPDKEDAAERQLLADQAAIAEEVLSIRNEIGKNIAELSYLRAELSYLQGEIERSTHVEVLAYVAIALGATGITAAGVTLKSNRNRR